MKKPKKSTYILAYLENYFDNFDQGGIICMYNMSDKEFYALYPESEEFTKVGKHSWTKKRLKENIKERGNYSQVLDVWRE